MGSLSNRKLEMRFDSNFRTLEFIYKAMDKWCLDPIIGLFIPGFGDIITAAFTVPFIFSSLFKLRSVSLTLAVISNCLVDMLIGSIPVIGDIGDFMYKSYKRNYFLIVGYVNDDPEVMKEINSKAIWACVIITVCSIAIRLIIGTVNSVVSSIVPQSCTADSYTPKQTAAVVATQTKPSEPKKAAAPSATPVSSTATFYCANTKDEVTFDYGYVPYTYGDYVILSGDNGALGRYSGYNVVSYKKSSDTYNYVCYGAEVIVYAPMVISLYRKIVKEGDCEADTEWKYAYEYYSGTTNKELTPKVYSGTLGKYRITVELAFDPVAPKVAGTLFYKRNGPDNRMYVYGDLSDDGSLVLLAYDPKFHDKPNETFFLNMNGSVLSGHWEKPNRDRLEVNLSSN